MKLKDPDERIHPFGGKFSIIKKSEKLSKVLLNFDSALENSKKRRWFLWYDNKSMSEIEAKHELLKIFAMEVSEIEILKVNNGG